ncbi:hypothetical protein AVJ24_02095 [Yersinia pestis]|nr:hypothetical protein AVJ24_02095 [Yersinia pestis]
MKTGNGPQIISTVTGRYWLAGHFRRCDNHQWRIQRGCYRDDISVIEFLLLLCVLDILMAERFIAARLVVSAMAFEAMAFEAKAEIAEVTAHANNFFYRLYFPRYHYFPLGNTHCSGGIFTHTRKVVLYFFAFYQE